MANWLSGSQRSLQKQKAAAQRRIGQSASAGTRAVGYRSFAGPAPAKKDAAAEGIVRHRRWVWILAAALTVEALVFVIRSPWMDVRAVRVAGLKQLTPQEADQVTAMSHLPKGTNLFRARTRDLERSIASLPFVSRADAYRRFPPALLLKVTPRTPVAVVEAAGGSYEVDRYGVAIRAARPGLGLSLIIAEPQAKVMPGTPVESDVARAGLEALLTPLGGAARIGKIAVDQGAELCLNMNDGILIHLGPSEDLPAKLALLRRIYQLSPGIAAQVQSIDLRSPEAPVCTPRDASRESHDDSPAPDARLRTTRRKTAASTSPRRPADPAEQP